MNSATIVTAALDNSQLENSINALVKMVDEKAKAMAKSFTDEVARMEQAVKNLGNIKIDSGSASDGGSSRRTSKQKEEETQVKATTQAYKEQSVSLDQLASAQQKAIRLPSEMRMPDVAKSARESFQAFYKGFNEQARQIEPLVQSWEKLLQARHTGNIEQVAQKIAQVKHEIAELVKEQANLSKTKPQGYLDEIAKRNPQIKALREQLISLETEHQKLKASDPFKDNPYLNTLREKLQGVKSAMNDADTTNRRWLQTTQQLTEAQKKSVDEQMKLFYARTMKIPTDQYDMQIAKLERIQSLLQSYRRGEVSFTPAQLSGLEKEERTLSTIVGAHREIYQTQQQVASSTQQTVQYAHQYTEEIKRQAQAIRESQQWKEKGYAMVGDRVYHDPERSVAPAKNRLSLEEQILNTQKEEEIAAIRAASAQRQEAAEKAAIEQEARKVLATEQQITAEQQKRSQPKTFASYDSLRESIAHVLGMQQSQIKLADTETASYNNLSTTLKQLKQAYDRLTSSERNSDQGKVLVASMHEVERAMQRIKAQAARPVSLESIIGINGKGGLPEKTLDDIAYKMQRLSSLRSGLDVEKQQSEIRTVNTEYDRLKKKMDEVMQKNQQMIGSNNALGRSWNYMKNRLAFYFTVGASTQFVKNLIDIRGQYELLERSIGILIDSAQNGSQIFAELNSMAIKSPFTTMELGAAAKQLAAYDVAAKDVVDTTRRLADMAAAVGIPIERLTYALGQIKAYGYLNARDARMFANAGIPLVKELADRYTELEGRLVSTSDVYDRIKKKAISYEDVMATVNKMTDEGGKFFNFQEKAADTLKVRIANLTLAWNNMLNEMGKSNQGVLAGGLKMLKNVFEHWRDIHNIIISIITTLGVLKATQVAVLTITAMHIKKNITLWTAFEFAMRKSIGAAVVNNLRSIGSLLAKFANPLSITAAVVTALGIAIGKAVLDYRDLIAANEAFNKSISDNAKENIESIEKFFEDYKKQLSNIGGLNNADQEKLWERIQEEIEKTTKNAEDYIKVLNDVKDVSSRIRLGEGILEQSKTMQGELQRLADSGTFSIGGGFANDSAAENLQNYQKALNEIRQEYGSVNAAIEAHTMKSRKLMADYTTQRDEVRAELNDFVSKLNNAYMPEILGQSDNVDIQMANVRSFAESLRDAFIATEKGSKIGADGIAILNNVIDKWVAKQGVANNLIVKANGGFDEQRARIEENRTAWEEFFRYISKKDREYLDAAIKTNNIGSDEVKKIWDKAAEEMSKRTTTSYDLIQDQIAQLRNTPDIVINVVYRSEKEKLEKDQEEFQNKYIRPKGWSALSPDEYLEQEKANREKYGTLMRKQGEDTVEYEKRISDERKTNLELQKKNGDIIEENKNKTDAYSKAVTEQAQKEKDAADERLKLIKEVEAAGGYDFSTKSENAAARKAQKQAESELAKALKDELSTIEKVRSIYKELTKEGMSHADAVKSATEGWEETVNAINKVLNKNGLKGLNLSDFVGIENPREILKTLQAQLDEMVKRGAKPAEIQVLQEKIKTIKVDAEKYDLTKITKGLNNELDRLKEEYELAVSLDADPELGNMFADWMGIDVNDLPRTANEYAERASKILNNKLKELGANIELPNVLNITDDDMRAFEENKTLTDKQIEIVRKSVQQAREIHKKEVSDQIKDWEKLLEKYAEYQTKVNKIQNDAVKERVTFAQQFGSEGDKGLALQLQAQILAATDPQEKQRLIQQLQELVKSIAGDDKAKLNIVASIDNSETRGLAKASFEEFQKSPEWIAATGELSGMTNKAIGGLIKSLEKYKKSAKNLDQKQIKNINNALKNLYKEQRKNNPFGAIANMLDKAKERMADIEPEMESIMSDIIALEEEIGGGDATEEQIKTLEDLKERWKTLSKVGEVSASEWVGSITSVYGAIKGAIGLFDDLAKAIGGNNASDIDKLFGVLDKAGQGAALGAQIGGGWGALIGGVAGGLTGVITTFAEQLSGNKAITNNIKESEKAVRQLELTMKSLEHTSDDAFGAIVVGSKQSIKATKELQLAELRRQLTLEQSRSSKYKDEERINELQGQILDLEYEVKHATSEIVNNLLGISSHEDFFEGLISDMINAFKSGKDAMKVFSKKWAEMIDSMVVKMILGQVLQQWVNNLESGAAKIVEKYTKSLSEQVAEQENVIQGMESMDAGDIAETLYYTQRDLFDKIIKQLGVGAPDDTSFITEKLWFGKAWENGTAQKIADAYMEMLRNGIGSLQDQIGQKSLDATEELIEYYTQEGKVFGDQIKDVWPQLMQQFGYKYGQDAGAGLSALKQGIQGITEDTAGALEAYMNGVSQQVYLQSDLLTQIRDAVFAFDVDVQVATMSQILLQLQSSYTVQMSIQGILEGVLNPSGRAFTVELLS